MENNRRKYVRLNKIFPVELKIVDSKNRPLSDLMQGFTRDVSFTGLCVQVNSLKPEHLDHLKAEKNKLQLFLTIPLKYKPVKAIARVAWIKHAKTLHPESYMLGLSYHAIDRSEQARIMNFAKITKAIPRLIAAGCIAMILFCGYLLFENIRLTRYNSTLIGQLGSLNDQQIVINQYLDRITAEKKTLAKMMTDTAKIKEQLQFKLVDLEDQVSSIEKQKQQAEQESTEDVKNLLSQKKELESQLAKLIQEHRDTKAKIKSYDTTEQALQTRLKRINTRREVLEDKTLDLMRQWLVSSQSSKTGLVVSYDNDQSLIDVGFTYDQALSAFNFLNFREYDKAKRIFDFYLNKAEKVNGGYANAYDVITGKVSEYIVHTGPAIYLGLAVMKYEEKTKDMSYHKLVDNIGQWMLEIQQQNSDGSLPGGPKLNWAGTEQNIAAYVFFKKLFKSDKDNRYAVAYRRVYHWLKTAAFNKDLKRFNRGTDDKMIATDTIALSILAFGPDGLEDMGIEVDDLIACVEENCKTTVTYKNAEGKRVRVSGFDFCAPSSISRGGTIAVEWTAQMVLAFERISDFYRKKEDITKAKKFQRSADYYLGELEKLMLVRTSFGSRKGRAGLPYASNSCVDTGHGWNTPDSRAISAAGTNFAIFAKQEYNIF